MDNERTEHKMLQTFIVIIKNTIWFFLNTVNLCQNIWLFNFVVAIDLDKEFGKIEIDSLVTETNAYDNHITKSIK